MEATVARPLSKKPRRDMAIHCLLRMLCTVCANQFGEISYVTLMATFVIKSVHKLVSSDLTIDIAKRKNGV